MPTRSNEAKVASKKFGVASTPRSRTAFGTEGTISQRVRVGVEHIKEKHQIYAKMHVNMRIYTHVHVINDDAS
jgi:hypothetical protein